MGNKSKKMNSDIFYAKVRNMLIDGYSVKSISIELSSTYRHTANTVAIIKANPELYPLD